LKAGGIQVKEYPRGTRLTELLNGYGSVAIPFERTVAPEYLQFKDSGFQLVDSMPALKVSMSVKDENEITNIKLACVAADNAFMQLLPQIKEGMTENDVAALLEYLMRRNGASGTSFETICAFGVNSSVPHHETGNSKLAFGDIVLIDFGCKVNGYCSDCTRTFLFGDDKKHGEFIKTYDRVLQAHMLAKQSIVPNMTGKQADAVARDYLKGYGLDTYFTHSLGHGIGVNIHEYPFLSPSSADKLVDNMVFSDEPGVYFKGQFGIRIEDTVMLSDGKIVSLTNTDKKLLIL
jgi:Xaa-Pro aminopeptidase